jgi:hypothetical protein
LLLVEQGFLMLMTIEQCYCAPLLGKFSAGLSATVKFLQLAEPAHAHAISYHRQAQ